MAHRATTLVAVCWTLWVVVWMAGAVHDARHAPVVRRRVGRRSVWVLIVIVVWLVAGQLPGPVGRSDRALALAASARRVPAGRATALTLWARVVLGTMWSRAWWPKKSTNFAPTAPTGSPATRSTPACLACWRQHLLAGLGHWLLALVLSVSIILVKVHLEERLMTEVFPDEYEEYLQRVPQLIPGLRWHVVSPRE